MAGPQGRQGPTGDASTVAGPQGRQGPTGDASTTAGPQGRQGPTGTGDAGPQGRQGPTGTGDAGPQGRQGPTGPGFNAISPATNNALLISNGTSTGATTNAAITVSGNTIYADGFWQNSSRYLKNNIIPFNIDALALLNQVNIVTFNYKDDKDSVSHIGFIAEDTPIELSSPKKNAMDIPSTVGVLIKAIQQLEARIKELESK